METRWDPLESEPSTEIVVGAQKRQINNILKSYVGFYDPFCELLQNAMDAVDARQMTLREPNYEKKIWIKVDLQENYISVTDNGIGFKRDEFRSFLCPNISFKGSGITRGNKGVGSTYIAYAFNFLQLATKTSDFTFVAEFTGGRKWLDDTQNIVTRPLVTKSKINHDIFNKIDQGKNLQWVNATTANQWKTILLIKTPLGHISLPNEEQEPIYFNLEVVDQDGSTTVLDNEIACYVFPDRVIPNSQDLWEMTTFMENMLAQDSNPNNIPSKFKNLNAIYSFFDKDKLLDMLSKNNYKNLIEQYSIHAYGYFCYSTRVLDEFSDKIAGLRKGMRIIRGGLQLSTNNMPQGELVTIPLKSNIGYQNQARVVVYFKNADPDLGRKGFQPELRQIAEDISVAIVNTFKKWRKYLKKETGTGSSITDETNLFNWIQDQVHHEQDHPVSIQNTNFFIPINEISITSEPASEQDVIVLFNQLIAGGVIRGIKIMATSAHQQYDGIFKYYVQEPLDNHVFHKHKNPLGVQELSHHKSLLTKPYVLEYKYTIDSLIHEFENSEKFEGDIDLAIAWEVGTEWKKRYCITSLLDLDNLQHRTFHGQTHVFLDENSGDTRFYGIILSDLIHYLNDIGDAQVEQKQKYGSII